MDSCVESSKRLATIGSILLLIPVLNIVGAIFVLSGMKGLAEHYQDNNISRNAIIGTFFSIIWLILITINMLALFNVVFFTSTDSIHITSDTQQTTTIYTSGLGLFVTFIFITLMALFFRRALNTLSDCSGKRLFRTAGTLLLTGATLPLICTSLLFVLDRILQIIVEPIIVSVWLNNILIIGLSIVYMAFIAIANAFSSLKSAPKHPTT